MSYISGEYFPIYKFQSWKNLWKNKSISMFKDIPRNQGVKKSLLRECDTLLNILKDAVPISVFQKEFISVLLGELLCVGKGNDTGLLNLSELFPAIYEPLTFR
jgi:hypothetical protein